MSLSIPVGALGETAPRNFGASEAATNSLPARAPHRAEPTEAEVQASLQHVRMRLAEIESAPPEDAIVDGRQMALPVIKGKIVGKFVLKSLAQNTSSLAFHEILGAFGYGEDYGPATLAALGDIQRSLSDLHQKMDVVLDGIRALMDQATRQAFEDALSDVAEPAQLIDSRLRTYANWLEYLQDPEREFEVNPDRAYDYAEDIAHAIVVLRARLVGTAGAMIPRLLNAASVETDVTNLDDHWEQVRYYRDAYVVSLSQAMIALHGLDELAPEAQIWSIMETPIEDALITTERMFEMTAVPIKQAPEGPEYIHVKGEDWIVAPGDRPTFHYESTWSPLTTESELMEHLLAIAATFDAGVHEENDLQEFLAARGFDSDFFLIDSFGWHHFMPPRGSPWARTYHSEIQVRGNSVTKVEVFGPLHYGADRFDKARNESEAALAAAKEISPQIRRMEVGLNDGYRAAVIDEQAIRHATYGIDGFEFDPMDSGWGLVLIPSPFGPYGTLVFRDAETEEILQLFRPGDLLAEFTIPANGDPERLILVEQGEMKDGAFYSWAQSAIGIDSRDPTVINMNGIETATITIVLDEHAQHTGVVRQDGNVVCGEGKQRCDLVYDMEGGAVTFVAGYWDPDTWFESWSGACSGHSSCTVDPSAGDQTIHAHYSAN